MNCQAEPFLLPRSCWGGWTPSLQGRSGPGLGSHSLCPRGRSTATSRAPSVHLSVHLSRRAPRVSFTPAPQGWFSGLSPADKKEHFPKARRISEKQVSRSPTRPLLWLHNFFSFVLGSASALERFFRRKPGTEVSFKIALRDQTDAGPSLVVLASKVKSAGSEGLGQSRPDQQEVKAFPAPLLPNLFLLPFPFAWGVFSLSPRPPSPDVRGLDACCPVHLLKVRGRKKSFTP